MMISKGALRLELESMGVSRSPTKDLGLAQRFSLVRIGETVDLTLGLHTDRKLHIHDTAGRNR
jgi:hypothetical protein